MLSTLWGHEQDSLATADASALAQHAESDRLGRVDATVVDEQSKTIQVDRVERLPIDVLEAALG